MTIKQQLTALGWSVYRFKQESGIGMSTAYKIANEELKDSALVILTKLWLAEKIKSAELNILV